MKIYLYNKNTGEFCGTQNAEANPEETKIKGKFVPLIPAYATLTEPPEFDENEIPVFVDGGWEIEADYRHNFLKVDENMNVSTITEIGKPYGYYIVTKEAGEQINQNPEFYKFAGENIIRKSDEEINTEQKNKRESDFYSSFFNTSLGWIRRSVTMKDGTQKDFLSDLLPSISAGFELGNEVVIITYQKPNFNENIPDMEALQERKKVTKEFIQECLTQLVADFGI